MRLIKCLLKNNPTCNLVFGPIAIYLPSCNYCTVITTDNIDNSGMRFTITRTPREYNASVSGVGAEVNSNLFVPPNIAEFDIYGYCNSDCTSQVCKMI